MNPIAQLHEAQIIDTPKRYTANATSSVLPARKTDVVPTLAALLAIAESECQASDAATNSSDLHKSLTVEPNNNIPNVDFIGKAADHLHVLSLPFLSKDLFRFKTDSANFRPWHEKAVGVQPFPLSPLRPLASDGRSGSRESPKINHSIRSLTPQSPLRYNASILSHPYQRINPNVAAERYGNLQPSPQTQPNHHHLARRPSKSGNPAVKRCNQWSEDEDNLLLSAIQQFGENWVKVSEMVPGRTNTQCRNRYKDVLDPSINNGPWTPEEDARLVELQHKYGNRWSLISPHMPGRTDLKCRDRFARYTKIISRKLPV